MGVGVWLQINTGSGAVGLPEADVSALIFDDGESVAHRLNWLKYPEAIQDLLTPKLKPWMDSFQPRRRIGCKEQSGIYASLSVLLPSALPARRELFLCPLPQASALKPKFYTE